MAGTSPKPEEGKKKARIEIIPLIDVIFFLLATFVLFTLSLNKIVSVPLQLPEATTTANPTPDPDMVTLLMSDAGTAYWSMGQGASELININEIEPRLERYKTQVTSPKVLIAADNRAKFGPVVMAFFSLPLRSYK